MNNQGIRDFFQNNNHYNPVKHEVTKLTSKWLFQSSGFPIFIQTQENVNRMRMVVFIIEVSRMFHEKLTRLMIANYCSALDARYAIENTQLVSAFLHSFSELTEEQFLYVLFQLINCDKTCGTTNSSGTTSFGHRRNSNRFQNQNPPYF